MNTLLRRSAPLAVVITLLCGLIYTSVQQNYRQTANDPQIQLAEDGAVQIAQGAVPGVILPGTAVDIAHSLAPFVIVYDESGSVLSSNGFLDGVTPATNRGILEAARRHVENRVTWQPAPGVRIAAVVTHVQGGPGGFVLAGRSLREVEHRELSLLLSVCAAWIVMLAGTVASLAVFR